jgi:hypothetical protein
MPIVISYLCDKTWEVVNHIREYSSSNDAQSNIWYLCWDYADVTSYYYYTGKYLRCAFAVIANYDASNLTACMIDSIYHEIVKNLSHIANCFVPQRSKSFHEFWWSEE